MVLTLNKCLLLLVLLFSWLAAYTLFYFPPPELYEEDIFIPPSKMSLRLSKLDNLLGQCQSQVLQVQHRAGQIERP